MQTYFEANTSYRLQSAWKNHLCSNVCIPILVVRMRNAFSLVTLTGVFMSVVFALSVHVHACQLAIAHSRSSLVAYQHGECSHHSCASREQRDWSVWSVSGSKQLPAQSQSVTSQVSVPRFHLFFSAKVNHHR